MKFITKILFAASLTYAVTVAPSLAQTITFDENGHGSITGGGPLPFAVAPDPSGGIPTPVLIYTLPFLVNPGDVGLLENSGGSGTNLVLSDLVRFYTPSGQATSDVIFYSDVETGENNLDLADTGIPQTPGWTNIVEMGPEGNNGAVWTPIAGIGGSLPAGGQIQYNIISDVPEPRTLTLAAFGGGLALAEIRRRRHGKF
jgi:hypothetical protein